MWSACKKFLNGNSYVDTTRPNSVCKTLCFLGFNAALITDPGSTIEVFVSYFNNKKSCISLNSYFLQEFVKGIDTVIDDEDNSTILVITSQGALGKYKELSNRKRICKKGGHMCLSTWSDALEKELKTEQKKINFCKFMMISSISSLSDPALTTATGHDPLLAVTAPVLTSSVDIPPGGV